MGCVSHGGWTFACHCSASAIRKVPARAAIVVEMGWFRPSLVRVRSALGVSIHEKTQLSPGQGWDLAGESLACVLQGLMGMYSAPGSLVGSVVSHSCKGIAVLRE